MCGALPWVVRSIFSICSPNCNSPLFNNQYLAPDRMDPELDSLIEEHNLSHRKHAFVTMGIKTFYQMATVQKLALKENHLFNYADIRAFETLQDICIEKLEEKDNTNQQVKQRTSSTVSTLTKPLDSEIGDERKLHSLSMPIPLQVTDNPPMIAPLHSPPMYSPPNPLIDQPYSMPVSGQFHPYSSMRQQHPFQPYQSGFPSIQQQPQHSMIGHDQRFQSLPPFQRNYYPELRPRIERQRHPSCPLDHDQFQNMREPQIRSIEYHFNQANPSRGIGIIFTNEIFMNHSRRDGAQNDENNFVSLFQMMGLRIYKFSEKKSDEIIGTLADFARNDLSNIDMFAVAFSTHGDKGDLLYGSDHKPFSLYKQIINLFKIDNCVTLRGKPKLFFIQACRGDKTDATSSSPSQGIQTDSAERDSVTLETDFLIAHSSVEGYKAYRHVEKGSWYVTQLKRAFEMYANDCTMLEVLSLANQLVVEKSIMSSGGADSYIQTCQFESTLTKLLKIKPIRLN